MLANQPVLAENCIAFQGSSLSNISLSEAFATARRLGFSSMTLLAEVIYTRDRNPVVEEQSLQRVLASIEAAGRIGAETVTVHADQIRVGPIEAPQLVGREQIVRQLRRLGEAAAEAGTLVCFENGGNTSASPDMLMSVLDDVDHPAVGATLDTGESYLWWVEDGYTELPVEQADRFNERLGQFIDGLGEKLFHVHITDIKLPELSDQHQVPGTGVIDWTRACRHLRGIGYRGLLELEHHARNDLEREAQEAHAHLREAIAASAA
jgi:sugar phosphate isomerase/epimerase